MLDNGKNKSAHPTLEDVFVVDRPTEEERYESNTKNDHLIWHGSRVSNFGGILS